MSSDRERVELPSWVPEGIHVTVTLPDEADLAPDVAAFVHRCNAVLGDPAWAVVPIPGTRAELTPLGRYLVRRTCSRKELPRHCSNRPYAGPCQDRRVRWRVTDR